MLGTNWFLHDLDESGGANLWLGGWVGGGCFLTIRLSQPSLAGVRAGAELGNLGTVTADKVSV